MFLKTPNFGFESVILVKNDLKMRVSIALKTEGISVIKLAQKSASVLALSLTFASSVELHYRNESAPYHEDAC